LDSDGGDGLGIAHPPQVKRSGKKFEALIENTGDPEAYHDQR